MNARKVRQAAWALNAFGVAGIAVQVGAEARNPQAMAASALLGGLYLAALSARVGWKER